MTAGPEPHGYALGVDLGTTRTAAAVSVDGRLEVVRLGAHRHEIPSLVYARADGEILVGDAAERRGAGDPERLAREFKRRVGDQIKINLGGTEYAAPALMAMLLSDVIGTVADRQEAAPDAITVTHPANWTAFKRDRLAEAFRAAGLAGIQFRTEPEAVAVQYAAGERVRPDEIVAVYDLGGGTFDTAILRKTATGFEVLGEPKGLDDVGGGDFDEEVYAHVAAALDGAIDRLDPDDEAVVEALARLRADCLAAKEALSFDTDVMIPVALPGLHTRVRLNRSEFEARIAPRLDETIEAVRGALRSAATTPAELKCVLLAGGSSRIPLVGQLLTAAFDRPAVRDPHPEHSVALGAALLAGKPPTPAPAPALAPPVPPPPMPMPVRPEPMPVRPEPMPVRPEPMPVRPEPMPVRPEPVVAPAPPELSATLVRPKPSVASAPPEPSVASAPPEPSVASAPPDPAAAPAPPNPAAAPAPPNPAAAPAPPNPAAAPAPPNPAVAPARPRPEPAVQAAARSVAPAPVSAAAADAGRFPAGRATVHAAGPGTRLDTGHGTGHAAARPDATYRHRERGARWQAASLFVRTAAARTPPRLRWLITALAVLVVSGAVYYVARPDGDRPQAGTGGGSIVAATTEPARSPSPTVSPTPSPSKVTPKKGTSGGGKGLPQPRQHQLPNMVDRSLAEARALLAEGGFTGDPKVVQHHIDGVDEGVVVDTDPNAGTWCALDRSITLTVSGPAPSTEESTDPAPPPSPESG